MGEVVKKCPQEEISSLGISLTRSGFSPRGVLDDEVRCTFREPGLEALRLNAEERNVRLGDRQLSLPVSHLDDPALVYEDVFAGYGAPLRPGCAAARLEYREFRRELVRTAGPRCELGRGNPGPAVGSRGDFENPPFGRGAEAERAAVTENLLERRVAGSGVVVALVDYPLLNPAWFVFSSALPITFGVVAYVHAIAYQAAYAIERNGLFEAGTGARGAFQARWPEEPRKEITRSGLRGCRRDTPFAFEHREPGGSSPGCQEALRQVFPRGGLGVWGHGLDELLYNGASRISVHDGPVVFAELFCEF